MKVFGTIAEFNPFHNGHAALFAAARQLGATHTVATMSGNFVQRGEPAITEKRVRAHAALLGGADLIIELPLPFATATAQRFALGAVGLLQASGVVDSLLFGSEEGHLAPLEELVLFLESPTFQNNLPFFLEQGMTFAAARSNVVEQHLGGEYGALLTKPNNILGIEYLRATRVLHWQPEFHTIPRRGTDHDSQTPDHHFASASFLRQQSNLSSLSPYVPPSALEQYHLASAKGLYPAHGSRLEISILADLRRKSLDQLAQLPDISEGIQHRLHKAIRSSTSLEELYDVIKTKRYTHARVRRLVLSAYLGITEQDATTPPPYLHVLGFNEKGRELLGLMKERATLPLSSRLLDLASHSSDCQRFATLEASSTNLFTLALPQVQPLGYEQRTPGIYLF